MHSLFSMAQLIFHCHSHLHITVFRFKLPSSLPLALLCITCSHVPPAGGLQPFGSFCKIRPCNPFSFWFCFGVFFFRTWESQALPIALTDHMDHMECAKGSGWKERLRVRRGKDGVFQEQTDGGRRGKLVAPRRSFRKLCAMTERMVMRKCTLQHHRRRLRKEQRAPQNCCKA